MNRKELADSLYNYCCCHTGFYPTDESMLEMADALLEEFNIYKKPELLPETHRTYWEDCGHTTGPETGGYSIAMYSCRDCRKRLNGR